MTEDTCEVKLTDAAAVSYVKKRLSDEEKLQSMAELFKTLADPTRIRIIEALALRELCVCDLSSLLALSQSGVSHQLRVLRQMGLVRYRKEGKSCYYRLDDNHVSDLLKAVSSHTSHKSAAKV